MYTYIYIHIYIYIYIYIYCKPPPPPPNPKHEASEALAPFSTKVAHFASLRPKPLILTGLWDLGV